MSKENLKGMSRRSFIGMGAVAAAAAGVAGLAGCAPTANGNASATREPARAMCTSTTSPTPAG